MPEKLARVRRIAWVALLLLGAVQGWVFRHVVSPDGVAYLDLSDAIVNGRLRDLVNGYWSPAYPALVGVLRLLVSPTPLGAPYWEFALLHVVSFLGFALSLAAFEWFLRALDEAGARWDEGGSQRLFATPVGRGVAYLFFAISSLGMISVAGTVPDFFLSAAMLAAFACALRLRDEPTDRSVATRLGGALAFGALVKSIAFPLGAVILVTLAVAIWKRGGRAAVFRSFAVFGVVTLPWILAMSFTLGRPTLGQTGALNYAWYVNEQQPPNTGAMPALAAPRDSVPLAGLAVLPDARGTNPLWYDPARWHSDLRPRFSAAQQWKRLSWSLRYYVFIAAPILLAAVAIGAGGSWRELGVTLRRSSMVLLPCAAALGAYALVYTTSRHVAVFILAAFLTLATAFPRDAQLNPARFGAAFGLTLLAIEALAPPPLRSMVTIAYGLALFMSAWVWMRTSAPAARWLVSLSAVLFLWTLPLLPVMLARAAPLVLGAAMWLGLSRASRPSDTNYAEHVRRIFAIGAVIAIAIPGLAFGAVATWRWISAPRSEAYPEWIAAQRLILEGVPSGSRIALLGNPENSGWARLARLQIVAVVPDDRVEGFNGLSASDRARLVRLFALAGATRVVSRPVP